jgi:hypothetical protein
MKNRSEREEIAVWRETLEKRLLKILPELQSVIEAVLGGSTGRNI